MKPTNETNQPTDPNERIITQSVYTTNESLIKALDKRDKEKKQKLAKVIYYTTAGIYLLLFVVTCFLLDYELANEAPTEAIVVTTCMLVITLMVATMMAIAIDNLGLNEKLDHLGELIEQNQKQR